MDIELAPNISYICSKNSPIEIEVDGRNQSQPASLNFDYIKTIEAKTVIVLSFRSLQPRRIADLQDKLVRLAVVTASGTALSEYHKGDIDKALQDYCTCTLVLLV